ncbi:MAG TPA: 16S rRNA methyltransferase [Anaerolineae bacterium]|nr:16S rRNA methyltransferase [Anaerolineae bacterium]HOQ98563.1 16S rRNA methyltransferase [Anaerolineae bacterium]HPL28420.1 16S rRNA methyltransferase [Anaerolineae bacterium]
MDAGPADLDRLAAAVAASARYRHVCPDLVRSIGACELGRRRSLKQAIKATKDRLHQAAGAYVERRTDYAAHLAALRQAAETGEREPFLQACAQAMASHTSSRERLPILGQFYATTLAGLSPLRSVLDVACGLNPLALPWLPLAAGAAYYAYDIYEDMMAFVSEFLRLAGMAGEARAVDVIAHCPARHVDLALLLKAIPCLERIDAAAGAHLLDTIAADHLLVSFPVRSLCGVAKGMPQSYEAHFVELIAGRGWAVRRFQFASELAFLVSR